MSRSSSPKGPKKGVERRKKPRTGGPKKARLAAHKETHCWHCGKNIGKENQQALYVEEEIGRIFCNEQCIAEYFMPQIEELEQEYLNNVSDSDFTQSERENLAHLRWITLQEPDEVWRRKNNAGDYIYTLISKFKPNQNSVWIICNSLFLRGEPSFLFLAFPTKDALLVDFYRRGERADMSMVPGGTPGQNEATTPSQVEVEPPSDRLADRWTEDEITMANMPVYARSAKDIPEEDYSKYQNELDQTLEQPEELWSQPLNEAAERHIFHFIRHFPKLDKGIWAVIIARELEEEGQIEILDAFPTRDPKLVQKFRVGEKELIGPPETHPSRVVH